MSQLNAGPVPTTAQAVRPGADLYSVLLIVATVLLALGTIFVAVRSQQLFGSLLPPSGG
ncbi:MAG: hypothetical protein ACPMAQ_12270 [Phycisphaerae bacterium]